MLCIIPHHLHQHLEDSEITQCAVKDDGSLKINVSMIIYFICV